MTVSKIWSRFKRIPRIIRLITFSGLVFYFVWNAHKIRVREREQLKGCQLCDASFEKYTEEVKMDIPDNLPAELFTFPSLHYKDGLVHEEDECPVDVPLL